MGVAKFSLTTQREGAYNITGMVRTAVAESGVADGICVVYCPHTTAAVTINEKTDPAVPHDLLLGLAAAFPARDGFLHAEGNSAAHLKASCVGPSETLIVASGDLVLGTWQDVFFCEFDGPRNRNFLVKIM